MNRSRLRKVDNLIVFYVPAVPLVPGDRFGEYTTYLEAVEAQTREFADTKRVRFFNYCLYYVIFCDS